MGGKERAKSFLRCATKRARDGARWVARDFKKSHLFWVKVVFLFQVSQGICFSCQAILNIKCYITFNVFLKLFLLFSYFLLKYHMPSQHFFLKQRILTTTL